MGCFVWPSSPSCDDNSVSKPPTSIPRAITKSPDEGKAKPVKNQKKPPRFMKIENVESNKGTYDFLNAIFFSSFN